MDVDAVKGETVTHRYRKRSKRKKARFTKEEEKAIRIGAQKWKNDEESREIRRMKKRSRKNQ